MVPNLSSPVNQIAVVSFLEDKHCMKVSFIELATLVLCGLLRGMGNKKGGVLVCT